MCSAGMVTFFAVATPSYSNSGAVQGYRYNARVLARHLAESHFGMRVPRRRVDAGEVVSYLLAEVSQGPELWHQRSYLARVLVIDADQGIVDDGIVRWPISSTPPGRMPSR